MKRMKLALQDGATVVVAHSWRRTVIGEIRQSQAPADLSNLIADALPHLPAEQRVILELAYRTKCSREDIARILNCSVETVMTRMSEGTKALKQIIR